MADFGYDVADYTASTRCSARMDDFDALLAEAQRAG